MKKKIVQYTASLLLVLFTSGAFAQDDGTLDTKVRNVLTQMPTNDLVHLNLVMNELIKLGPQGIQKLTQLLTPPGVGDDTAVRFGMNCLARYASKFGMEEVRNFVETSLLEALDVSSDTEVKTFLLNQLNLVAGDKSVNFIKKYLADEELIEPTTQTLLSIGSANAARVLLDVFSQAGEPAKVTIAKALGELRYEEALLPITKLVSTENKALRKATLTALASIGHPASYKLLLKAAKDVNFEYEPTDATDAFLIYAYRLSERGETKLCQKALKTIFKANKADDRLHNYASALSIYAKIFDYESIPLLMKAAESNNKEFRCSVLKIAENIGEVAETRQWIKKAGSVPTETKAEIIDMLGRRGDLLAADFITENLNTKSPIVREESINALVRLCGKDIIPVLINHLAQGNDLIATKTALLQLINQNHLSLVAAQIGKTSGPTKAAFINLVAAKAGNAYFKDILSLTNSQNQDEKDAAFDALKNISTKENLDALIELLLSVDRENEVKQVQLAVIEATKGIDTRKTETVKLLQALSSTNKKERIITILPEIGGDVALKTVTDYFRNSTGVLKEKAFDALTGWKDYSAATSLYEICQLNTGEYSSKAFPNFVRLVSTSNLPDDQKLLQYRKIMHYASSPIDQKQVISAIGNLKTFLSLVYLEQFLNDNELQKTVASSIMEIALPDSNGENGFSGEIVRNLLKRIASIFSEKESEYDLINTNSYLEKMPKEEGFVSMFNGKNLVGWKGLVGNPITRAKMSKDELAKKQEEANLKMLENWSVKDHTIVFNGIGANLCSVKEYGDFEMVVDWRITKRGDSGIYLRGSPQVQIWDTSLGGEGEQIGSGGLYNNQKFESKPLKVVDNPIGEWNTFLIKMMGENVTVYLNGDLVVDNIPFENYWDRSQPIFEIGPIELQAHGNALVFRDIYVKEINPDEISLTE